MSTVRIRANHQTSRMGIRWVTFLDRDPALPDGFDAQDYYIHDCAIYCRDESDLEERAGVVYRGPVTLCDGDEAEVSLSDLFWLRSGQCEFDIFASVRLESATV